MAAINTRWITIPEHREKTRWERSQIFSVKVAGDFSEDGSVALGCLVEGEVGFASFLGFGDFGEDARDESRAVAHKIAQLKGLFDLLEKHLAPRDKIACPLRRPPRGFSVPRGSPSFPLSLLENCLSLAVLCAGVQPVPRRRGAGRPMVSWEHAVGRESDWT